MGHTDIRRWLRVSVMTIIANFDDNGALVPLTRNIC